jgi:5-methylcytosine-specific restriction endonuclease McrA
MRGVFEKWDYELTKLVQAEYQTACDEYRREFEAYRSNETTDWWEAYQHYLGSAVWQVKRTKVIERAGGICEACGENGAEHVHHLKYPKTFGLEPLWDLRAVCRRCHEIIHEREIPRRPR